MSKIMVKATYRMDKDITECTTLGEIRDLVTGVISRIGENVYISFDSGHNFIEEEVTFDRLESNYEYEYRMKQYNRTKEKVDNIMSALEFAELAEFERLSLKFGNKNNVN